MPRKKDKKDKVTKAQLDVLCTYFEENPELLLGYNKTSKSIKAATVKWQKITPHLNSLGVQKTASQWATFLRARKSGLKAKRFKWKQNQDGSGPIICNADDFNELWIRMLQVFRRDASKTRDSQNSHNTSYMDSEDNNTAEEKYEHETIVVKQEYDAEGNEKTQAEPTQIFNPNDESSQIFVKSNDERDQLDTFARNMAQQLRALPLKIALETQEMMRSIMYKQRLKVLNDVRDPLDKKIC